MDRKIFVASMALVFLVGWCACSRGDIPSQIPVNERIAKDIRGLGSKVDSHQPFVNDLAVIGTPAVPALILALKGSDLVVRARAETAVGSIGPGAALAVPHRSVERGKLSPTGIRDGEPLGRGSSQLGVGSR